MLARWVQRRTPVAHEIVPILGWGKEQPMLAAMILAFAFSEERRETGQPLLAAGQQVFCRERINQLLQTLRGAAFQEGIITSLPVNVLFTHADREPTRWIQAASGR